MSADGRIGIKDVAVKARVSPGTVSNVLNRPERVAEVTRRRVLKAIEELGFVRNGSASTLRAGHARTIGLMVLDLGNPFFTDIARGVDDVADERGYAVILCSSGSDPIRENRNLRMLAEQRVRGLLVTPADDDTERLEELPARGVAEVMLDHAALRPDQCSVSVDDVAGGRLAAGHVLGSGARDVAYVSGPKSIRQCADRLAGAAKEAAAAGGNLRELVMPAMAAVDGQRAAAALLDGAGGPAGRRSRLPDAVFCANDMLALGVLRGLMSSGVKVPEDIRLIGYDDIEFADAAAVPLTSVRQPTYQLGRLATSLLLDECDTPETHAHQQILFQPELVVRDSTAHAETG